MMETGGAGSTQKKLTMSCSTPDIISNLPYNVLDNILVCLTIQDAARTSVLSRKWRYRWTTLPQLVFNDEFCRGSVVRATTDKLMLTIYKVLLLHQGPLLKFTLSLADLKSCPEIDPLIFFVSKTGIREFKLYIRKGEVERYKLPSTLFSCLQLEHLNLRSCVFKPPPGFKAFTGLLSLVLYEVSISGDVLSSLTSNCPLLESLKLRSPTSLNYLEIVAPNIKYLWCECLFKSFHVKIPHGAGVSVFWKGWRNHLGFNEGEISNSAMLLCSIPVVVGLALDYHYVKCMAASGIRERLPTTLDHLMYLQLNDVCFGEPDEVSTVSYFIRSSPNLKALHILAFHRATAAIDPVVELFDGEGWSDVSLNRLRFVQLGEVSGTKVEREFIRLLLAKSPMLETMLIRLKSKEVAERLRIVEELTGFRRASAQAVITFSK
ncbi:F-box/FBD/LRR-repeat protein At1g13570-like [Rhododendron vialii]|uniref:F-box/FBD/LRR-repeat protein At1g13570-like n=1 Tax=Rhododendron vialii TaxID=182163 RepID=UPI0026601D0A|nr:F-box/FBD/LRR-repeat protein At1g13570-like [Rhododendron vialii]XP_058202042.1 F-box/FBD/LRR-repeat protein At1g13570-like [Rhododendron vialii]